MMTLKRRGEARLLSEVLESVGSPEGSQRLATYLASRPYPHYEPAPAHRGLLVKIDEDGTRTLGRFVQRVFTPLEPR